MNSEQRFTLRIPQEDYDKLRVVAAMRGLSINAALRNVIGDYLDQWEQEHGPIQVVPK